MPAFKKQEGKEDRREIERQELKRSSLWGLQKLPKDFLFSSWPTHALELDAQLPTEPHFCRVAILQVLWVPALRWPDLEVRLHWSQYFRIPLV